MKIKILWQPLPVLILTCLVQRPLGQGVEDLTVRLRGGENGWVARDEQIEIELSRALSSQERVAVFLGTTDMSDLVEGGGANYRLSPQQVPYPNGEVELIVYHVGDNFQWRELSRFPLRFLGRFGFQEVRLQPSLNIGLKSQVAEGHSPPEDAPLRETFADWDGRFGFSSTHRGRSFLLATQTNLVGFSNQEQALRFSQLGREAPQLDLSDYRITVEKDFFRASLGHVSFGSQRHLVNDFGSRGLTLGLDLGSRVRLSLAAANGSSIVGWGNFLGLDNRDHQLLSAALALDLLPRSAGAMELELSFLDGSVLPLAGFNQGVVNDAEESEGVGLRLAYQDPTQRLHLEGGFARSTFTNPNDPLLAQGAELVEVEETTDQARYLNLRVDVFRDLALGSGRNANLSVAYRHERVDPLFRSVGAYVQSNLLNNSWEASGQVAHVVFQVSHSRMEDNLDEVPSILKTKTRRSGATASFPLNSLLGSASSAWPEVSYAYDRTHQFGAGLPVNSEFADSHIPDQLSTHHVAALNWQVGGVSLSYNFNRSFQDNRQRGRDRADFRNSVHGIQLAFSPHGRLNLGFDVGWERALNLEVAELDKTWRYGVQSTWSTTRRSSLNLMLSRTLLTGGEGARRNEAIQLDTQWSLSFPLPERGEIQYFLRFGKTIGDTLDRIFGFAERRESWTVNTGFTFSLF